MVNKNKSGFRLEAAALFSSLNVNPDRQFIPEGAGANRLALVLIGNSLSHAIDHLAFAAYTNLLIYIRNPSVLDSVIIGLLSNILTSHKLQQSQRSRYSEACMTSAPCSRELQLRHCYTTTTIELWSEYILNHYLKYYSNIQY